MYSVVGEREDAATRVSHYESLLRTSARAESRRFAVRALGRVANGTTDLLVEAMSSDPAADVRAEAAQVLARRADDDAARSALVRALADPAPAVVLSALEALVVRRDGDVVLALERRLGTGPAEIQRAITAALAAIHADDPVPFIDRMMGDERPESLVSSVNVLELMANPVTSSLLEHLARSRSPELRAAAVRALGALPSPNVTLLDELAGDPVEEVRRTAREARSRARAE